MDNTPLVSILMNCFNGERYLREAIDSIFSQTYQNWELVFWDNQSTDNSKAIFDSYQDSRLKYYYAPKHTDLGGGRANAFKYLRGDYIDVQIQMICGFLVSLKSKYNCSPIWMLVL